MRAVRPILSLLREGVLIHRAGLVLYANPALLGILGYPVDHELSGTPLGAVAPAGLPLPACVEMPVLFQGRAATVAVELARHPGIEFEGSEAELLLVRNNSERRLLEHQLVELANREGERLARELHDGLGQELAALSFQATALQSSLLAKAPEAAAAMGELLVHLQEATEHARQLSHGLAAPDEKKSIAVLLAKLARTTEAAYPVSCVCRVESSPTLSPESTLHILRIAQEAVTNAIRHGRARRILLTLSGEAPHYQLAITDNGLGFSKAESGSGIGLRLMECRAHELGGRIDVSAAPGGGTMVVCQFFVPPGLPRGHQNER